MNLTNFYILGLTLVVSKFALADPFIDKITDAFGLSRTYTFYNCPSEADAFSCRGKCEKANGAVHTFKFNGIIPLTNLNQHIDIYRVFERVVFAKPHKGLGDNLRSRFLENGYPIKFL